MNNHDEIKQLISSYFDGEITSDEKAVVVAHLKECAACQAYYIELHKLSAALKKWPDESLSADLQQKLYTSLPEVKKETYKMKNKNFNRLAGTVAAFVIIGGLVSVQVYINRGMQGRLKAAADDIGDRIYSITPQGALQSRVRDAAVYQAQGQAQQSKSSLQYEPYYLSTLSGTDGKKLKENISSIAGYSAPEQLAKGEFGAQSAKIMGRGFVSAKAVSSPAPEIAFQAARASEGLQNQPYYQSTDYSRVDYLAKKDQQLQQRYISGGEALYNGRPAEFNTEEYKHIYENQFLEAKLNPLSTFSIDVDNASYSNIRRFLSNNQMPPEDAVRVEEMINYFSYDYPDPSWNDRFSITLKGSACPWNPSHSLVQIGIQGKKLDQNQIPPSNLVFLIDVSGSMNQPDKLPLLKEGLRMLVNQLNDNERVAIVVYAGAAGLVLESTPGTQKYRIMQAIDSLQAGGSTAGGAGIQLAYQVAKQNFIRNGNNRVILATDGDFNVGVNSDFELGQMIEEKRKDNIFLTVLGFGTGNLKDSKMEQLADKGNGNYFYIDNDAEARKVLVHELGSTLFTIAKDVKIQVEFNPAQVKAYKLIGYENRMLAKQDFNDDKKDAGELGAGHTVTALYEIIPTNDTSYPEPGVDPLVYQQNSVSMFKSSDVMTVKLRFKEPTGNISRLVKKVFRATDLTNTPDTDFKFAASVAEFGLLLRNSPWKAAANYEHVLQTAMQTQGVDKFGYRQEFIGLVERARALDHRYTQPYVPYEQNEEPYFDNSSSGINFKGK